MNDGNGQSPLLGLWAAMRAGDVAATALPYCHLQGRLWSALLFRAAIRDEFREVSDPRHITQRVHKICAMVPEADRERLLARREADAIIRAEVNGELDLIQHVHDSSRSAFLTAQLITRDVFVAVVKSGHSTRLARRIVEAWQAFGDEDWLLKALNVVDPRPLMTDDVSSDVRALAGALPGPDGGEMT